MNHPELSILIPAAGASTRLGQPKQLVEYRGNCLLHNAVQAANTLTPCEIIVVTGANAPAIKNAVQDPAIRWLENPHWSAGMGGSIAMAAATISPKAIGVMILLCDQWRIQAADLQELQQTWRSAPECIVVSEADGRYMPPAIFPSSCFSRLRSLSGDQGARSLLHDRPEQIKAVSMKNAAYDLDTPAHLDQLQKKL